jgi:hypothetical protein
MIIISTIEGKELIGRVNSVGKKKAYVLRYAGEKNLFSFTNTS